MSRDLATAWSASETIGMSIPNPRAVGRITIPKDLTPKQLAWLERWIDETNAQLAAEQAALDDSV